MFEDIPMLNRVAMHSRDVIWFGMLYQDWISKETQHLMRMWTYKYVSLGNKCKMFNKK
jgi:hypothetical protein